MSEKFPGFALPEAVLHSIPLPEEFQKLLAEAVGENRVKSILPKYFNGLLRRQGVVNNLALRALDSVGHSLERLAGEIENRDGVLDRLVQHVNAQNAYAHRQQSALLKFGAELTRALNKTSEAIALAEGRSRDAEANLLRHIEGSDSRQRRQESASISTLRVLDRQLSRLQAVIDGSSEVFRKRLDQLSERYDEARSVDRAEWERFHAEFQAELSRLVERVGAGEQRFADRSESERAHAELRTDLSQLAEAAAKAEERFVSAQQRNASEFGLLRSEVKTHTEQIAAHISESDASSLRLAADIAQSKGASAAETEKLRLEMARLAKDFAAAQSAWKADAKSAHETTSQLAERLGVLESENDRLRQEAARLKQLSSDADAAGKGAVTAARDVDRRILSTVTELDRVREDVAALAELHQDLQRKTEALAGQQGAIVSEQVPLLGALRDQLNIASTAKGGARTKARRKARELVGSASDVVDDSFYVALENRFRGSRQAIRERLSFYLPEIEAARERIAGLPKEPAKGKVPEMFGDSESFTLLDLGCGRGEWLRLLGESQIAAIGVDTNKNFLEECVRQGSKAVDSDIFDFLSTVPDGCLGAISCFHVIEHLNIGRIRELFHHTFRTLRRGGVALFETPHAGNLVTGALNFHLDPTHHRPVHHLLARFVAESAGFSPVRTEFLHPNQDALKKIPGDNPTLQAIGDFLFGPQDFGLIAVKP